MDLSTGKQQVKVMYMYICQGNFFDCIQEFLCLKYSFIKNGCWIIHHKVTEITNSFTIPPSYFFAFVFKKSINKAKLYDSTVKVPLWLHFPYQIVQMDSFTIQYIINWELHHNMYIQWFFQSQLTLADTYFFNYIIKLLII